MLNDTRPIVPFGRFTRAIAGLIFVLAIGACGRTDHYSTQPVSGMLFDPGTEKVLDRVPDSARAARQAWFYPLEIGDRWTYDGASSTYIVGDSFVVAELYSQQMELIGTESLGGREYVVEKQSRWSRLLPYPPPDSTTYWVRYRQDRSGLYEADVPIIRPPGAPSRGLPVVAEADPVRNGGRIEPDWLALEARLTAAGREAYLGAVRVLKQKFRAVHSALVSFGSDLHAAVPSALEGPVSDELTRLKYPLHPGQEWYIRTDPFSFVSRVERLEVLDLPAGRLPGYRIRTYIDGLSASDRIHTWYGRSGFLGLRYHLESVATDPLGNPLGTLIFDDYSELTSVELVHR